MKRLVQEKEKAEELRRIGYSYTDILKEVKVSKSSLSLWLKGMPLTDAEKDYLRYRGDANISKGRIQSAISNRMRRSIRDGFLFEEAKNEFKRFSNDPFFFIGIALYWAEGSKRNAYFAFTNSDSDMIALMVTWVQRFLGVKIQGIRARLYTHKSFASENQEVFWSKTSGIPLERFGNTVYKQTGLMVKKRPDYKGCLRIELKVAHLRKLKYWQKMLIGHYREER